MKKIVLMITVALMLVGMIPTLAAAQNYDIKEMTPAIRQALDNRRARFDALEGHKQTGALGEDNRGYIAVLIPGAPANAVAADENRDRQVVYSAIADENNLSHAMGTIEGVFAGVQRDKARPGEYIQREDGQWVRK